MLRNRSNIPPIKEHFSEDLLKRYLQLDEKVILYGEFDEDEDESKDEDVIEDEVESEVNLWFGEFDEDEDEREKEDEGEGEFDRIIDHLIA